MGATKSGSPQSGDQFAAVDGDGASLQCPGAQLLGDVVVIALEGPAWNAQCLGESVQFGVAVVAHQVRPAGATVRPVGIVDVHGHGPVRLAGAAHGAASFGRAFDDPEIRERKFQAMSAVWRMDAYVVPPTYSREELLGYVEDCRGKADTLFADLTDDQATAPLPEAHRHRGQPFGEHLLDGVTHLLRHSVEVRTFLRRRGVRCADE